MDRPASFAPQHSADSSASPARSVRHHPTLSDGTNFHELFARERALVLRERHRQAISKRWYLTFLAVGLAAVGKLTHSVDIPWSWAIGLAATTFVGNLIVHQLDRRGRF